jgi:hypothetical protein
MSDGTRRTHWSQLEVEVTVAAYFELLEASLRGESLNKSQRKKAVAALLNGRSPDAVEYKFRNISAILAEDHVSYISGFTPLYNYQDLLREVVLQHLWARRSVQVLLEEEARSEPASPTIDDILNSLVQPPAPRPRQHRALQLRGVLRAPADYLLMEARNQALGRAGEEFVVRFEQARLITARRERLAAQVEQVSVSRGDGLGYDILSFDEDGRERLVEVKTTKSGEYMPFYVTRNELAVSQAAAAAYHLYRVFRFGSEPGLFMVSGSLDQSCRLEPNSYIARSN